MCHNKNELRSAVAKYRRLKAQKAEIDKQLKEAQDQIFDYIDYNNVQPGIKVVGQNYVVSFSTCISNRWDKDSLISLIEASGKDVSSYQIPSSYRRLSVK